MTQPKVNLNITIDKVSSRVLVANYPDYFSLNSAAVVLDSFIVVVDTLYYPSQGRRFHEYLETTFNKPVQCLFLTHYHGDHVFGMSAFKGAEIIGTNELMSNMRERLKTRWTEDAFNEWKKEEPLV